MRAARPRRAPLLLSRALAVAALAGCATPAPPPPAPVAPAPARGDLIVLLPGRQGTGAVTVTEPDGRATVLDAPYAGAQRGPDGRLRAAPVSPEEVRAVFGEVLAALPPPPVTFVLYFVEATEQLTPESAPLLDQVLAAVAARPAPEVIVVGHTDTAGSDAFNDALSLRRAERVRGLLVGRGLPAERVVATGRGERELQVPTADGVAEPRNRRVEITVR